MMKYRFAVRWQLVLVLFLLLVPLSRVRADAGPKPSMEFEFIYKTESSLTIVTGEQLECTQADCAREVPLEELGPQRFECDAESCFSLAYGYKDYHRLVVTFSDGVTRESDVFGKRRFGAFYRVVVHDDALVVQEVVGSSFVLLLQEFSGFWPFLLGAFVCLMVVFLLLAFLLTGNGSEVPRGILLGIWVLGILFALLSIFFSWSLLLTLLIEGVLVFLYVAAQGLPRWRWMTYVLVINVISQPLLYFLLVAPLKMDFYLQVAVAELLIWLGEAGLFYLLDRQNSSFKKYLLLSLLINFVSFGVGWLLAV